MVWMTTFEVLLMESKMEKARQQSIHVDWFAGSDSGLFMLRSAVAILNTAHVFIFSPVAASERVRSADGKR